MDPTAFVTFHLVSMKAVADECDRVLRLCRANPMAIEALIHLYEAAYNVVLSWSYDVQRRELRRLQNWPYQLRVIENSVAVLRIH